MNFNEIPSTVRVPWAYVEFDGSKAQQGVALKKYKILLVGQKVAGGSKSELTIDAITNKDQGPQYYGAGSNLCDMAKKFIENNAIGTVHAISIDDHASAVVSTGTLTLTGSATAAGVLSLYIGGKAVKVAVSSGDSNTDMAASIVAAVTADSDLPVAAANTLGVVTFTAKNKGLTANQIDLRVNYFSDDALPAGVTVAFVAMASGAQNPDISEIFPIIGDEHYDLIIHPWTDAANLTALETELSSRNGPLRQIDGYGICASKGTHGENTTLGESRNSRFTVVSDVTGPTLSWEWAAALGGQVSASAEIDPGRPFQNLQLKGISAPSISERRNFTERNNYLYSGIATHDVAPGNVVKIERVITTYKKNLAGADDTAYLDLNTLLTISFLRYSYRNRMLLKYPRHKLASDGAFIAPGVKTVTPGLIKAETVALFREWEELGLVEGVDQFKNDLIVERSKTDPNRLDTLMMPDLVNQMRVVGTQIAFLL